VKSAQSVVKKGTSHLAFPNTAPFRGPVNAGRRFIPLLLADCKLPYALRRLALWRPSVGCKPKGLKAQKIIAQGKRSETSAALGQRTK
jgi:hypothetical protein